MSSFQTDDKSLYRVGPLIRKQRVAPVCQKACRGLFVWQEDGENALLAGNSHAERAVTGSTDLYTKNEFDPWKEEFEAALDAAGLPWKYNSFQYEEDTGFYHHEWYWEVI